VPVPRHNLAILGYRPPREASGAEATASLVAISPQRPSYCRAVRGRAALEFDLLSDEGLKVGRAFRLVFTLPSYLEELYRPFGPTLDKFHGEWRRRRPCAPQSDEPPLPQRRAGESVRGAE